MIIRPGLFFYAFIEQPYTVIQDNQSSERASAAITDFWRKLGEKKPDPSYQMDLANPLAIPWLLDKATLLTRLSNPIEPIASAELAGGGYHRACLQSVHEMLTFRLCYSDPSQVDLSFINIRRRELVELARGLQGLIGTVQVIYFEIGQRTSAAEAKEEYAKVSQELANSIGLKVSPEVVCLKSGHWMRRATLPGGRDEHENGDTLLLGFLEGQDDSINDLFYRRLSDIDLPRMAYYFLATAKTRRYYDEFRSDFGSAELANQKIEYSLIQSRKDLQQRELLATEHELETLAGERAEFVRKIARLQRLRDIVVTNRWSQKVLMRELFVVRTRLIEQPLYNTGNFLVDDLIIAERNEVELKNKLNVIESFQMTQRTEFAVMQNQFRAVEAQHEEEFARRIHLLELFVVAVYGVELVELYEKVGIFGAGIALAVGAIAACYLYIPQLRTARARRTIGSTMLVCLALILLPLSILLFEHEPEKEEAKEGTPPIHETEESHPDAKHAESSK